MQGWIRTSPWGRQWPSSLAGENTAAMHDVAEPSLLLATWCTAAQPYFGFVILAGATIENEKHLFEQSFT